LNNGHAVVDVLQQFIGVVVKIVHDSKIVPSATSSDPRDPQRQNRMCVVKKRRPRKRLASISGMIPSRALWLWRDYRVPGDSPESLDRPDTPALRTSERGRGLRPTHFRRPFANDSDDGGHRHVVLFARRYQTRFYKLEIGNSVVRAYTPERSFGTILVGIGFASYLVPVLKPAVEVTASHKDKSHVKYLTS
jgi:hypothetical protein